ncbi:MAG: nitrite/sulfite reductase [Acidobacteria bacterium]|nr:nitrite/sulfite reductase [Acidobacteriota bacterium]
MAIADIPLTALPESRWEDSSENDRFIALIQQYRRGEIDPEAFKPIRLKHGIYGIRASDTHMVRVKLPGGRVTAEQFAKLGDIAERYARGVGHVTTRQDIQYHWVTIEDVPPLLRELESVGLTTREACGNSVRNVTACPLAGVCSREVFDIHPHSLGLARHLLRNPKSQDLPRKFKISVSGCDTDCAMAAIHDIGLVARKKNVNGEERDGFRLLAAGGLGSWPRPAMPIAEFVPVEELSTWTEAILEVFAQFGNRKDRNRARMKFVLAEKGFEWFQNQIVSRVRERGVDVSGSLAPWTEPVTFSGFGESGGLVQIAPLGGEPKRDRGWLETNVWHQKQNGLAAVWIKLPSGAISTEQFAHISNLAATYGDGTIRTSATQNILLPNVAMENVKAIHEKVVDSGLAADGVHDIGDVVSCPGAETCNLGITKSRNLAEVLRDRVRAIGDEESRKIQIKISGCPNSCGQHHVADIGFHGMSRKVEGDQAPYYQLLVGGSGRHNSPGFANKLIAIHARRIPEAVDRIVGSYERERRPGESFAGFAQRKGVNGFKAIVEDLTKLDTGDPSLRFDWGEDTGFKLKIGQGECAS